MRKYHLRSVMAINNDNQIKLAEYLGISENCLSHKMNEKNGAEFTQGQILKIKTRYNLTPDEVDTIFFSEKVS